MENWHNKQQHIAQSLEKRYQRENAPCHINGNAKTSEVRRQDEYAVLLKNIVEPMARRMVESGEKFSVLNHVEPHHFKNALALAIDYSGIGAGDSVKDPNGTNDSMVYRYLVGLEFEKAVNKRADEIQNS